MGIVLFVKRQEKAEIHNRALKMRRFAVARTLPERLASPCLPLKWPLLQRSPDVGGSLNGLIDTASRCRAVT